MSDFLIFSDRSGNDDKTCINKVAERLNKAGHNAEKAPVDSNSEHLLWDGKCKGKIGVFLVNGAPIVTMISFRDAVKKGLAEKVIFGFPRVLSPSNSFTTEQALKNKKLHGEPGINTTSAAQKELENGGKYYSVAEFCDANSEYIGYVYGDNCEKVAEAILNGDFGTSDGSSEDSTSNNQEEEKPMSGWESLLDLIKPYDGEIFLLVRGDTVICRRIEIPEWSAIWAYEGVNIVDDSVTVTDYSPEIYNTIEVEYGSNFQNTLKISFNKHVELFGERKTTIQATKKVSQEEYEEYQKWLKGKTDESTIKTSDKDEKPMTVDVFVEKEKKITDEEINSDYESPMDKFLKDTLGITQPNQR